MQTNLKLPVHLPDNTSLVRYLLHRVTMLHLSPQEMPFDSSTTVQEFVSQLNMEMGMLDTVTTGFALMSDWPGDDQLDGFYLFPSSKLCDVVSMWSDGMAELGTSVVAQTRTISLTYRKRVWHKSKKEQQTDKEALLTAYQVSTHTIFFHQLIPPTVHVHVVHQDGLK